MRLLVTGGAGYIGSVVVAHLLEGGHEVTLVDDLCTGHREAVPEGAAFVELDLLDRERLREVVADGFDGALHFAARALVAESMQVPELYWRVNVGGAANLLDALRAAGVLRFVFSSTCAVYGVPGEQPITEDQPPRPINAYGASKLAVDQMLTFECVSHELGAVSLRYFNVAGADRGLGEDHDPETHLVPNVLRVAAGKEPSVPVFGTDYETPDGTAVRDYVHVRDLARAHVLALEAVKPGTHEIYNLGSGRGHSVLEVIDAGRAVTGQDIEIAESPRRPGDPPELVASNARISRELGWAPEAELEEMIADAWEFLQAHPDGYA